jgi:hypothetical protein
MGSPFRGSESEHSRQQLRGKSYERLTRDVYLLLPDEADLLTKLRGAQLIWPDAIGCLYTAAEITNLPVDADPTVHVARVRGKARTERKGITVHRWPVLPMRS